MESLIAWLPDLIFTGGKFESGLALVSDSSGTIVRLARIDELKDEKRINLSNRALLPGMVNSHSHAFQRVLRGRTEYRTSNQQDSFWTWREMMYSAATRLTPEDIYDASRMAFLEMALHGITAVGEFHYLHHQPDGTAYDDPNLLAKEVARAAGDVGLRIALLRVAYARSGFQTEPNPRQARFIEKDPEIYLKNLDKLMTDLDRGSSPTVREGSPTQDERGALPDGRATAPSVWVGVAPHSVRAVPLDYLQKVIAHANQTNLKVHMHLAEQPAEVSACVEEYGRTPVALLQTEGLLSESFTAVHAIHVTPKAIASFARTGAMVCACPTTERNLGDGVVPADEYFKHDVPICLGTDSHAQIDLLEDARELEYHLRLQKLERAVLERGSSPTVREGVSSSLAVLLFDCATRNGARSIGAPGGTLEPGKAADFFTVALDDPAIAGASTDDLLANIVFSLSRAGMREVVVGGKPIVSEGQHLVQEEIIERFSDLQKRLWS
ncbi:MAG TPA: formimidoylglutamate deiminase [Pyrinomonadaceae bacterium]|nr:formimidoylglutamate deiminase [Pyrinomonadaceae bacterium]